MIKKRLLVSMFVVSKSIGRIKKSCASASTALKRIPRKEIVQRGRHLPCLHLLVIRQGFVLSLPGSAF